MQKITQLDLFSGIGGFHLGFERAGYEVKSYFSEIDKHAVAVYKHRFKNSTYVGSVTDVRGAELPTIDLITFGSPCQDFSLAGKRKGMQGDRSSLVLEAIRLINECRPSVFIWENVKGTFSSNNGADFWAIIQAFANIGGYRLEWQLLNTSWVLPQNRERVYLVGYSTTPGGDWRGVFPIGEGNKESYKSKRETRSKIIDPNYLQRDFATYEEIAPCINARMYKEPLIVKSATSKGYEVATEGDSINLSQPNSETRRGRVGKGKAQTLDTAANQAVVQAGRVTGRNPDNPKSRESGLPTKQMLEINENPNKTNCISTVQKDNVVLEPNYRIRRLTPIECERLQGFPDNHTEYGNYDGEVKKMSNTQRYKQCGNAVTVDIVALVAEAVKPLFK